MTSGSNSKPLLWSGLFAFLLAFSTVYLVHYYGETRPTIAQPDIGRTRAVRIHERQVYLTNGEVAMAFASHALAILAIGVFAGVLLRSVRTKKTGESNP